MKNMKIYALLLSALMLLMCCAGCTSAKAEAPKDGFVENLAASKEGVDVGGLKAGMSPEEVAEALGLAEQDYTYADSAVEGVSSLRLNSPIRYPEFGEYDVDKTLLFRDGALSTVSYSVFYWDTEFATAFNIAEGALKTIDSNIKDYSVLDGKRWSAESGATLKEIGKGDCFDNAFMKQWHIGDQNLSFTLVHQSSINNPDHPDTKTLVNVQINIVL